MRYLICALRAAGGSIGEGAETMLQVPGASPTAWMHSLVNDLASGSTEITLVLDDYHVVSEPACHAMLQFLIDHAPESLRLILCTRVEPPLALGSVRAAGRLAEIRTSELRFTAQEATVLLEEADGLNLDHDSVMSLAARTEGWAAGLYLAMLWLRGRTGAEVDVERFAGDSRHLAAYLSEAVLGRLQDDVRQFLLATSIVDRICAPLCEAITGRPAAQVLGLLTASH
jgi:LuxR family maltose regulon positive regulatory protein